MKQFNLNLSFADGSTVTLPICEDLLESLKKEIQEDGFNIAFLVSDGLINLNQVCLITWEEKE